MSKIIFPEGMELIDYLNSGYGICNKCGALMDRKDDPEGTCTVFCVCPSCGWTVDEDDYVYDGNEGYTEETLNVFGGDVPPEACRACGGPYPYCKTSCKLFDD